MDFSVILVLPFAAVVTFIILIGAALLSRPTPRLIWPFAISVFTSVPVFIGLPELATIGFWLFSLVGLALWAAFGTVIGKLAAWLVLSTIRLFRGS